MTADRAAPLTPQEFAVHSGVDGATLERLQTYVDLLIRWQRRINLVSAASLADVWRRHLLDSAQLATYIPPSADSIVDIGSGAGFPGMVLAIIGRPGVRLIESDTRKCTFLREANRLCAAGCEVVHGRAEDVPRASAAVVTARAVAPFDSFLPIAARHLAADGFGLFPKGRTGEKELTDSAKKWMMQVNRFASLTEPTSTIFKVEHIRPRHAVE